jgi:hypothetical protein
MRDFLRFLVCTAIALAGQPALAQASLHLHMAGTIVEGSFGLAGKVVPLPPGKFKLVYQNDFRTKPVQMGNSGMRIRRDRWCRSCSSRSTRRAAWWR